jgi:hypothetical protein
MAPNCKLACIYLEYYQRLTSNIVGVLTMGGPGNVVIGIKDAGAGRRTDLFVHDVGQMAVAPVILIPQGPSEAPIQTQTLSGTPKT